MTANISPSPPASPHRPRRDSTETAMAPGHSNDRPADAYGKEDDPSAGPCDTENDAVKRSAEPEDAPAPSGAHAATGDSSSGEKPALTMRSHSLTDPRLRPMLKGMLGGLGPMIAILCLVVIWAILPIYWGSLYKITGRRLPAWVVNGDPDGAIGQAVESGILASDHPGNPARLHWYSKPWATHPEAAIEHAVVREFDAWIVVRVSENATAELLRAQQAGNTSWDPASVVNVYYTSSRNFNAADELILNPTTQILETILSQLNPKLAATWLASAQADGANTSALLAAAAAAPQTISQAAWYTPHDLRPFDQTVTVATTFVGLIYSAILTFNVSMALYALRQGVQVYLRPSQLILLRFVTPIVAYLLLALVFSMLNLPFHVTFWRLGPNDAAGFFAFFAATYVGFLVIGFWNEIFVSILTPRMAVIGLVIIIVTGVAGANYPVETLNSFYKWEYAMPFYNLKAIYTTIIFDVGKQIHILKHFGILWAWLAILGITFPLWVLHEQRIAVKAKGGQVTRKWPLV